MSFKVGDKVILVNNNNLPYSFSTTLHLNSIYTVRKINTYNPEEIHLEGFDNLGSFKALRFIKHSPVMEAMLET